jgi:hypothetical protein
VATKIDPNNYDYDKDGIPGTTKDRQVGQQDTSPTDGKVTSQEKIDFAQKQSSTTTKTTTKGDNTTIESQSNALPPVEPTLTAGEMGYSSRFLKKHPDVKAALELARNEQSPWTLDQFVRYVENNTEFGKRRTDAQALFDLNFAGDKREDLVKQINDVAMSLKNDAVSFGINITDADIQKYARESVRSGFTKDDALDFFTQKFRASKPTQDTATGETARIMESLRTMATEYGVPVNENFITKKTTQAISQGSNWQAWVEGQRNVFRNQAKMLYPKVADKFDEFTMEDLLDPYLNQATEVLGIQRQQMRLDDPRWTQALTGSEGAMTRDEWIYKLRTDKKFGYGSTDKAINEAASLGDSLINAFGMA